MDEIDSQLASYFPFNQISENIREVIDQETYNLQIKSKAGIDILFGDNDIITNSCTQQVHQTV